MKLITLLLLLLSFKCFGAYTLKDLSDVTVTTAGTRVQLTSSSILTPTFCVQAKSTNSGLIYVSGITVSATNGIGLSAGQFACYSGETQVYGFDVIQLNKVYLDASANGQVAKVTYYGQEN